MTRLKINLFAAAIIALGAGALGTPTAEAAVRGGCDSLRTAKALFVSECGAAGGSSYQCSTSCSEEEYWMDCTCYS